MNRVKSFIFVINKLNGILTRKQKVLGMVYFLLSLLCAVMQMAGVAILVPIVSLMTDVESAMHDGMIVKVSELTKLSSFKDIFVFLCLITICIYIFKNLFCIFLAWFSGKYSTKIEREISLSVLNNYLKRPYDFFLTYGTAQIQRDVTTDPFGVCRFIYAFFNILNEVLTMIMLIAYMLISDWKMAISISVIALICLILINNIFRKKVKDQGDISRKESANYNKLFLETIGGIKEVQVMHKQDFFLEQLKAATYSKQKPEVIIGVATLCPVYAIEGLFVSGMLAFICIRFLMDSSFTTELPILASFAAGAVRLLPSLGRISNNVNAMTYYAPTIASVDEHLSEQRVDITEKVNYVMKAEPGPLNFEKCVELNNICFRYQDSKEDVLSDLNLKIFKGSSIGIVGKSGAGKSTLADLILGLHIPQKGEVLADGTDIYSHPAEWSKTIGYVPQTIYLSERTIRENIAFGVLPKDIDDERVNQAVKQAQLTDFIDSIPDGLDTMVGERGVRLSGGQRQRLAIARAMYRNPGILVLDEATSALDNETEKAVIEAIEHLHGTITMIIIAHRITTVKKCDKIYEIQDGKAVEKTYKDIC